MQIAHARMTMALTAVMVVVFITELISALSIGMQRTVLAFGAIIPGALSRHDAWRLIAAIFLHGGVFHLLFNLWAFVQLGYGFESIFGWRRFLVTFFVGGLGASIASAMNVGPYGSVGASGAIFALLSAFVLLLMRTAGWRSAPWARRLAGQLVIWSVISIFMGFFASHIDNAAHLGGVVTGVGIGIYFTRRQ